MSFWCIFNSLLSCFSGSVLLLFVVVLRGCIVLFCFHFAFYVVCCGFVCFIVVAAAAVYFCLDLF